MALPLSVTLTIFVGYIAFFCKKGFSFLHNSIVFMVIAILTKNYMTIMTMQLKLIKSTDDSLLFLFSILCRDVIVPLLVVIFINLNEHSVKVSNKIYLFIVVIAFMQMMDILSVYFGAVEYIKWNLYYAFLINIAYILVGEGVSKILVYIDKREGQNHDRSV